MVEQITALPASSPIEELLDTDNGVIDGTVDCTVSIYSDPIGSFNIWEDTYHVRVDKGVFSVKLGSEKTSVTERRCCERPTLAPVHGKRQED